MSIKEIRNAVLDLPEHERGSLAAWILESLPPHSPESADNEGIEEAARRREELDSGKVQTIGSEEFWASIQQEQAKWK